ncbi:cerevisin [Microdochium nivale]|nr:cerevisin [Microdochium nivale]
MRSATATALLGLLPLAFAAPAQQNARAPLLMAREPTADGNKYIVRMKKPAGAVPGIASLSASITSCVASIVADADERYEHFGAFSARLDAADLASLRANPNVEYIEQDGIMELQVTQTNAPWGLARLSSVRPGTTDYTYDASAGAGACVYVIDSGVDVTHPELEGRAEQVKNTVDSDPADRNGHGTHVAGIVAAKTYGVAKKAKILAVKVFDASGRTSNSIVLAGMDFVISDSATRKADCPAGMIVNMSLGGAASATVDAAANRMVAAGLAVMVASGNGDRNGTPLNASTQSPARAEAVCTIGATDSQDVVGSFSNYGPALDLHAPGVSILSLAPGGRTATQSGTSMATPMVAGLAAYYLGLGLTTPTDACTFIASKALDGVITGLRSDTKNILVQNRVFVPPANGTAPYTGNGSAGNSSAPAPVPVPAPVVGGGKPILPPPATNGTIKCHKPARRLW